jgi:hypothetical protein
MAKKTESNSNKEVKTDKTEKIVKPKKYKKTWE